MNTPRTHVPRILLGLAFLTLACNRDDDEGAQACAIDDPPQCIDGGTLELCGPGAQWQTLTCAVHCQQTLGAQSVGCGYDLQSGGDACLCVIEAPPNPSSGDPTNTTNSDGGNDDGGNDDGGNDDGGNDDGGDDVGDDDVGDDDDGDDGDDKPCAADYGDCSSQADCCGYKAGAAFCVDNGGGGSCQPVCAGDSDCASDCCAELNNGETVCSPANYCPTECTSPGNACEAQSDCCDGSSCVNFGGGDVLCASDCTYDWECMSGCCAALEQGGGVCGPASICGGAPAEPDMPLTVSVSPAPAPVSADATLANRPPR
jgi:hypothetical protein